MEVESDDLSAYKSFKRSRIETSSDSDSNDDDLDGSESDEARYLYKPVSGVNNLVIRIDYLFLEMSKLSE